MSKKLLLKRYASSTVSALLLLSAFCHITTANAGKVAENVIILPTPDDATTFSPSDFGLITLKYPAEWTPAAKNLAKGKIKYAGIDKPASLPPASSVVVTDVTDLKMGDANTDENTVSLTLSTPDNLKEMEKGYYFIQVYYGTFTDENNASTPVDYFGPYYVENNGEEPVIPDIPDPSLKSTFTISPEGGATPAAATQLKEISELKFTCEEGLTASIPGNVDLNKISLMMYSSSGSQMAGFPAVHPTALRAEGNVVTAVFDPPHRVSCGNNPYYRLSVEKGVWEIANQTSATVNDEAAATFYRISEIVPFEPVSLDLNSTVAPAELKSSEWNSPIQILNTTTFPAYFGSYPYLRKKDGETVARFETLERIDEHSFKVAYKAPANDPVDFESLADGEYELVFPANGRVNYQYIGNAAQELVYEITVAKEAGGDDPVGEFKYTLSPAPQTDILTTDHEVLSEITLTIDGDVTLSYLPTSEEGATFTSPDGTNLGFVRTPTIDGNSITFYPDLPKILTTGEYTFILDKDILTVSQQDSAKPAGFQGCIATYTVKEKEADPYSCTLEPSNNEVLKSSERLRTIRITFTNAQSITVYPQNLSYIANLTDPDGKTFSMNLSASASVSGNTLTVPFPATNFPTKDGEYIFRIFGNKVILNMEDGSTIGITDPLEFTYRVNSSIIEIAVRDYEITVIHDASQYECGYPETSHKGKDYSFELNDGDKFINAEYLKHLDAKISAEFEKPEWDGSWDANHMGYHHLYYTEPEFSIDDMLEDKIFFNASVPGNYAIEFDIKDADKDDYAILGNNRITFTLQPSFTPEVIKFFDTQVGWEQPVIVKDGKDDILAFTTDDKGNPRNLSNVMIHTGFGGELFYKVEYAPNTSVTPYAPMRRSTSAKASLPAQYADYNLYGSDGIDLRDATALNLIASVNGALSEHRRYSFASDPVVTGVENINTDESAELEYFTIDGRKVTEPRDSGFYIVRRAGKGSIIHIR